MPSSKRTSSSYIVVACRDVSYFHCLSRPTVPGRYAPSLARGEACNTTPSSQVPKVFYLSDSFICLTICHTLPHMRGVRQWLTMRFLKTRFYMEKNEKDQLTVGPHALIEIIAHLHYLLPEDKTQRVAFIPFLKKVLCDIQCR